MLRGGWLSRSGSRERYDPAKATNWRTTASGVSSAETSRRRWVSGFYETTSPGLDLAPSAKFGRFMLCFTCVKKKKKARQQESGEVLRRSTPQTTNWRLHGAVVIALILAALASFWPALDNGFVNYDDNKYVTENPQVTAGLTGASIAWAFTSTQASNWHPITWLSHMLDCEFYGLRPRGHHFTNVALHAANAVLVFLLLAAVTGTTSRSSIAALLFAVHPLRVESVAWIAERKDVLSVFFGLLAMLAYVQYARSAPTLYTQQPCRCLR